MRVAIDCDEVLGSFAVEVIRFCNLYGRAPGAPMYKLKHASTYDILSSFGLAHLQGQLRDHLESTRFCERMEPYEGALEFVEECRKRFETFCVTSPYVTIRGWETDRRAWLKKHMGFSSDEVIFAKRKNLIRANWLIDDKTENCHEFDAEGWGNAICLDRPWNQDCESVRVYDYDQILYRLGS